LGLVGGEISFEDFQDLDDIGSLLSAVSLLAGCGHGLIIQLI
jgi:hypothetical protein